MGFSRRRSVSVGPVRLNFSRSGIGASVGVRGARISSGPRGTYIHLGRGGLRYSKRLDGPASPPPLPTAPSPGPMPAPGRAVEVVNTSRLAASSAAALLDEIGAKRGGDFYAISCVLLGLFLILIGYAAISSRAPGFGWSCAGAGIALLGLLPWAIWYDRVSNRVRIHYVLDPHGERIQRGLDALFGELRKARAIWSVRSSLDHGDWKRNAGAGRSIQRQRVRIGSGPPRNFETNVRVGSISTNHWSLYFFPDRILVFESDRVVAIPYDSLELTFGLVRFVESPYEIPSDALVVEQTWQYVNKDGGPDRRFANNRQLPVALYGVIHLGSKPGLQLELQTSISRMAEAAVGKLRGVQGTWMEMKQAEADSPETTPPPTAIPDVFADDPPPLAPLARKVAAIASLRWVPDLPGWAEPIAWAILISVPLLALGVRFARGPSAMPWYFLAVILAGSLCAIVALARAYRSRPDVWDETEGDDPGRAALRAEFRAHLMREMQGKPLRQFRFRDHAGRFGIEDDDANRVADDLYRWMADRVVADGVVTVEERRRLDILARALEIPPDRSRELEADAKSERYRRAVDLAYADGILTPAESRELDRLRASLRIGESD